MSDGSSLVALLDTMLLHDGSARAFKWKHSSLIEIGLSLLTFSCRLQLGHPGCWLHVEVKGAITHSVTLANRGLNLPLKSLQVHDQHSGGKKFL